VLKTLLWEKLSVHDEIVGLIKNLKRRWDWYQTNYA